jgi:hypothetical protein
MARLLGVSTTTESPQAGNMTLGVVTPDTLTCDERRCRHVLC